MDAREALRRSRQVIAVVADPRLKSVLLEGPVVLPSDPRMRKALDGFDWVTADRELDAALLRRTAEAVGPLLTDQAVLQFPRLREMPADEQQRQQLCLRVVTLVFERLGVTKGVSEERLNAALAMLVEDPATVRRVAVDACLLQRTADGRAYAIRPVIAAA